MQLTLPMRVVFAERYFFELRGDKNIEQNAVYDEHRYGDHFNQKPGRVIKIVRLRQVQADAGYDHDGKRGPNNPGNGCEDFGFGRRNFEIAKESKEKNIGDRGGSQSDCRRHGVHEHDIARVLREK